ncbi:MAG TPA: aspartate kinase [Clostridiaceae bacterium]|nr:aspartate kinase [Clostridiaceae bacterium]
MKRLVMKFGGTSVATTDKIKQVCQLILRRREQYDDLVVVVSAMGKTTDNLLNLAYEVSTRPVAREVDVLLSSGELISASLLALHLNDLGCSAESFTGFQAGFRTSGSHRKSKIENLDPKLIKSALERGEVAVVAGFQGMNKAGDITTLGRGGSDTSAVALAAKLGAKCEIYTDVDGIYSADPKIRPQAKKIDRINYEEVVEMAHQGARVIEARSVELAAKYNVPLYIALNTGEVEGTYVSDFTEQTGEKKMEDFKLTNVSAIENILLVSIQGLPNLSFESSKCFTELAAAGVNVDILNQVMIDQNNSAFSFTSDMDSKQEIIEVLDRMGLEYSLVENLNKVSIIGSAMRNQVGVAAKAFNVFIEHNIPFYMVSTSDISISYVVKAEDKITIINALADAFDL